MLHQHKVKVIFLWFQNRFIFIGKLKHIYIHIKINTQTYIGLMVSLQYKMFLSVGLVLSLQCKFLVLMSLSFRLLHSVSLTLPLVHAGLIQSIRTHLTRRYCSLMYCCHLMLVVVTLKNDECSGSAAAGLSSCRVRSDDFLHVDVTGVGLMNTADVHNSGEQLELVDVECSESCRSSCSCYCRLQWVLLHP